jgi:hypothetical protein
MEACMSNPATFLRRVLAFDAISCVGMGALMIAGAAIAEPLLGVPATLLEASGAALLPFAAFVGWLGSREAPPAAGVWAVIAINAIWVIDSLLLAAGTWVQPTTLGIMLIVGQALVVATLAELEYVGWKRLRLRTA